MQLCDGPTTHRHPRKLSLRLVAVQGKHVVQPHTAAGPLPLTRDTPHLLNTQYTADPPKPKPQRPATLPSLLPTYISFPFLVITLVPAHPLPFFFFNDPAPPEISPFPLHDALPISEARCGDTACRLGKSMNITWRIGPTFESTCHDSTKPQEGTVWKSAFDLAAPRPLYWRESK